jgi:hypothetical protein
VIETMASLKVNGRMRDEVGLKQNLDITAMEEGALLVLTVITCLPGIANRDSGKNRSSLPGDP